MYKQGKSIFNWTTVLFFVAISFIVIIIIQQAGSNILDRHIAGDITLSANEISYIGNITNIDTTGFTVDESELENSVINRNNTNDDPSNFALEFFFGKNQASEIESYVKVIFGLPTAVLQISRLPVGEFRIILNIINTLLWIIVLVGGYLLLRGVFDK